MWMEQIKLNLMDKPLNHIILPGTHNSGVTKIDWSIKPELQPGTFKKIYKYKSLPFVKDITEKWTINQDFTILSQLMLGIRYFDFRLSYINNKFYISHTFICYEFKDIIFELKTFFNNYKYEFIVIRVTADWENRTSMSIERSDEFINLMKEKLGEYIYPTNINGIFPTYETLMNSGKRILFYYDRAHTSTDLTWSTKNVRSRWTEGLDIGCKIEFLNKELSEMKDTSLNLNVLGFTVTAGVKDIVKDTIWKFVKPWKSRHTLYKLSNEIQASLHYFINKNIMNIHKISVIYTDFPNETFVKYIIDLNTYMV